MSDDILVFAAWSSLDSPTLVGRLRPSVTKAKEHFTFAYDEAWLTSEHAQQIDLDLQLYSGDQHASDARNLRAFLDSCPDRWGRLLMKRREAVRAHQAKRKPKFLQESDYLLGVHDLYRMGALRFKRSSDGPFVDDDDELAAPPIARLRELEHAAQNLEGVGDPEDAEYRRWLFLLMSPGSALGGARPKSCVVDEDE
jgi:serine/threonine-protein kinase HipA